MKTILKPFIFLALIVLIFTGCAKNDDFSIPSINCDGVNIKDTKTLQQIYDAAKSTPSLYEEDDVISGYVVSSDEGGNFFKELYLVNEDNSLSVKVPVDQIGLFSKYGVGKKIMIKLKGLYTQIDNGVLVIGAITTNSSGRTYVGRISDPIYKKHVLNYCGEEDVTKEESKLVNKLSLKEAIESDKYLGKLVELTEVQFAGKEIGKPYYLEKDPGTIGGATNRELTGKGDDKTILFRTGSFAEYSGDIIPKESGSITGILTKFGSNYQFIARSRGDIQLTEERFGNDAPIDNGDDNGDNNGEVTIGKFLVFPASDFEDWNTFTSNLSTHGLKPYATQQAGKGWENGNALGIIGKPEANDYVFTALNGTKTVTGATKLSFLVKGTSDRSVSINLYKANGTNYEVYNLENLTQNVTLQKANASPNNSDNGNNSYTGKINTNGQWVKVTLDLTGVVYNTTPNGNIFAIKVGKTKDEEKYDLLIDEIRFEDGVYNGGDDGSGNDNGDGNDNGSDNGDDNNPAGLSFLDFEDWNNFTGSLNRFGLQPYATQQVGQGQNNSNALGIIGTPTGNDFVFTLENIQNIPDTATKIIFYVKGTAGKSLSLNVYKPGTGQTTFNLGEVTNADDVVIQSAGNNQYTGAINTGGQWKKVTLDLTGIDINKSGSGNFFALKVGKEAVYNLLLDNFTIE